MSRRAPDQQDRDERRRSEGRGRRPSTRREARDLVRYDEVIALFDCALRGLERENGSLVQRAVFALVRTLDAGELGANGTVLAHFDSCLADVDRGRYDEAFETLLDLRETWIQAMATLRRDRNRAAHFN